METKNKTERKNEESQLEIHLCKICGTKMNPQECIIHRKETGHDGFKPSSDAGKSL